MNSVLKQLILNTIIKNHFNSTNYTHDAKKKFTKVFTLKE